MNVVYKILVDLVFTLTVDISQLQLLRPWDISGRFGVFFFIVTYIPFTIELLVDT